MKEFTTSKKDVPQGIFKRPDSKYIIPDPDEEEKKDEEVKLKPEEEIKEESKKQEEQPKEETKQSIV